MKRFGFALTLFIFLIFFNFFCLFVIKNITAEAIEKLDSIYENLDDQNIEEIAEECEKFDEFWSKKHTVLSLVVRHDFLDQTTVSVSKFIPFITFGEYGELASEISLCKSIIEQIWDSEKPLLRNIF